MKIKEADKYKTSSKSYESYIENVTNEIENIKEERENARHNSLIAKAQDKVNEAEKELNNEKNKAESKIKDAENDIAKAKKEIEKAENEITANTKKADKELANAKTEIESAKTEIAKNEAKLAQQEKYINSLPEEQKKLAQKEIEAGKQSLKIAKAEIEKQENELEKTKKSTYNEIEKAKREISNGKSEITKGEKELNDNKKEFEEKIRDAESKLQDAKDKISDIENPTWYVLDRNSNAGYASFIQDTDSIANIGRVFPIVFFVVATLISLTSMTRMVEEQRMQIGTLKALGYSKVQIMMKYIIYAGVACIIGGIIGMSIGFIIIPKVIWIMYKMMYQMTEISLSFNLAYGGIGLVLISICIIGATIYTALKELRNEPAKLMRPKAPKSGNRVMLERITFIWKHLNFSKKVTVRNIFRYKKRFLMTVVRNFRMHCTYTDRLWNKRFCNANSSKPI